MTSRLSTQTLSYLKRHNPDLAESIIDRYGVPDDMLVKIHVLSLWTEPSLESPGDRPRSVTVVALLKRKIDVQAYGPIGASIKCPDDMERMDVGFRIALGRAIRWVRSWS